MRLSCGIDRPRCEPVLAVFVRAELELLDANVRSFSIEQLPRIAGPAQDEQMNLDRLGTCGVDGEGDRKGPRTRE